MRSAAWTRWTCPALAAVLLSAAPVTQAESPREVLRESAEVLREIMEIPETSIPPSLMERAEGIAVIPNVVKLGFIIGGRAGNGVVVVRGADHGEWGYPAFVRLAGGSVGWQIGAQSSDVILVFKNRRGVTDMVDGKFTLGADAAVAAGPVGRDTAAATDERMVAEIYSYSRSRGLFAGISLDGSSMEIDHDANTAYYGQGSSADGILAGRSMLPPGPEAQAFMARVREHTEGF